VNESPLRDLSAKALLCKDCMKPKRGSTRQFRGLLLALAMVAAGFGPATGAPRRDASWEFFNDPRVRLFEFALSEQALMMLRRGQDNYVRATVREGNQVFTNVGVRLKGMGSFRSVHEKPSLAVKFDQFVEDQEYLGLTKLMFNNSVQDPTYVAEALGTELFREAGLPAARVTYARVQLNGRDLGLYVVIEAMNKRFLKEHFLSAKGNLYEAYLQDIDSRLEQDNGEPGNQADIRALVEACLVRDAAARFARISKVLDVDRFVTFAAMEILIGHWDGYVNHTNNYRIYHDPTSDKLVFITHGLDWAFRRPNISIVPPLKSLVGRALFQTPEGDRLFRERLGTLYTNIYRVPAITNRMNELLARVQSAGLTPTEWAKVERAAAGIRQRIEIRGLRVADQLAGKELPLPKFASDGTARLPSDWREESDRGEPTMDQPTLEGRRTLHIRANGVTSRASWRTQMYLTRGRYRVEALARSDGLRGGSGLRISGGEREYAVSGTSGWRKLTYDFEIPEGLDVEFVADFYGTAGEVWYDLDSFRVRRF
jgi:spore coat protein H